jgi:hypothetical protein
MADDGDVVKWRNGDRILRELWADLRQQRTKIRELRLNLIKKRAQAQELRKRQDAIDNSFMSLLRPYLAPSEGPTIPRELITQKFEDMQKIRDLYQSEELEINELEQQLEDEEGLCEVIDARFLSRYHRSDSSEAQKQSPQRREKSAVRESSPVELLGIKGDRPTDLHPLYRKLLGAVGDRELAREHNSELLMHRDSILYDLDLSLKRERLRRAEGSPDKSRAVSNAEDLETLRIVAEQPEKLPEIQDKHHLTIDEEDYKFLRDFSQNMAVAGDRLARAKAEVERLRKLCIEKGVMRKNAPYYEEYSIYVDSGETIPGGTMSLKDVQLSSAEDGLTRNRFPILLSNPRHVLRDEPLTAKDALREATKLPKDDPDRARMVGESMKEYGISTLVVEAAEGNKSDYVNRWLLHRLRISPMEVELLYTVFSTTLKIRNLRRWQEDVLYYWSRDKANLSKEQFRRQETTLDVLIIDNDTTSNQINSFPKQRHDRPVSDPGKPSDHLAYDALPALLPLV